MKAIHSKQIGSLVNIVIARDGQLLNFDFVLQEKSKISRVNYWINVLQQSYGITIEDTLYGAVITGVNQFGIAYNVLKKGDIIQSINDKQVTSLDDIIAIVKKTKGTIENCVVLRSGKVIRCYFNLDGTEKYMNKRIILFIIAAFMSMCIQSFSDEKKAEVILDNEFYTSLQNSDAIMRIRTFDMLKDVIVKGTGNVVKVEVADVLKKKFRIVLSLNLHGIQILYYCYTDQDEYFDLLQPDDLFEFSGQFVVATPLNVRFDTFIIDVLLEEGAVVVH